MPNRKTGANGLQNVYKPIFTGVSTMFQFQPLNWDDDTKLLAGVFVLFFTGGVETTNHTSRDTIMFNYRL